MGKNIRSPSMQPRQTEGLHTMGCGLVPQVSVGHTLYKIRQVTAEDQLPYNISNANLDEAVGGKWTMSAICLSDRSAGTYMSLQMHMTGRFNTLPPWPFFLPCPALPVYFPSTNFIRTSMDACKEEVTFISINNATVSRVRFCIHRHIVGGSKRLCHYRIRNNLNLLHEPTRCNWVVIFISLLDHSACFGRFLHPSSGVWRLYMQPLVRVTHRTTTFLRGSEWTYPAT